MARDSCVADMRCLGSYIYLLRMQGAGDLRFGPVSVHPYIPDDGIGIALDIFKVRSYIFKHAVFCLSNQEYPGPCNLE